MAIQIQNYLSLLVRHETRLWNRVERALHERRSPLTLGRLNALSLINNGDGSSRVQEVATELDITVGAASRLTDRLASDGLVERVEHSTDRRSSSLLLTEQGREALAQARGVLNEVLASLFEQVEDETVESAIVALESIQQALQQRDGKLHG